MHLKGLKMQGFKSFADSIELNFSEGITAIVGPNGSGKSNISDAVRWVLGEQSAKALRGGKMEDVIFNGTEARKRLGFAEVTLHLDNKEKTFRSDFDELFITRKVYASGESQYFINHAPCRLKDIHEVFMDTGLGRDGYSMVGQGKIDEILSSKSEDRREIFEEAAGISKYRYRKEEAERKLKHTDENIERVSDIIVELEGQIEPLTKQAEKAKKYLNLRDELKLYDVNSVIRTVAKTKEQTAGLVEKIDAITHQLAEVEQALSVADEAQEFLYRQFEELDEAIAKENNDKQAAEEAMVVCEREIEVLKSTIEGNGRLLERIEKESLAFTEGKTRAEQALIEQKQHLVQLEEELKILESKKEELSQQLLNFNEDSGEHGEEIDKLKLEIQAAFERSSEKKIKLSNVSLMEQNIKNRRREYEADLAEKKEKLSTQKEKDDSIVTEYNRKQEFLAGLEKDLQTLENEEAGLEEKLQAYSQKMQELVQQVNQKKTRLHLLSEMEQSFEGYYKSVREVMKEHDSGMLKHASIHGPVSKLIGVKKEYAAAIGSAIGGSLQNIVVADESDAKEAIACLKKLGAGRATFMPISAVKGSLLDVSKVADEPGYVGLASDLVTYDKQYIGIVQNLLGKTVVIDTLDRAIAISRKYKQSLRIVTLEGEIFYPGGSIAGGSQMKGNQLLGREQEIEELKEQIKQSESRLIIMEKEQTALEGAVLDKAEQREKLQSVYNENKEILLVLDRDRAHHGLFLSTLTDAIREVEEAILQTEEEAKQLLQDAKRAEEDLALAEQDIQNKRLALNELEQSAEAVLYKKQSLSDSVLEKGFEETAKRNEIAQQNERIAETMQEIAQAQTMITLRAQEAGEIKNTNAEHQLEIEKKDAYAKNKKAESDMHAKSAAELTQKRQDAEKELRSLQGDAKETRESAYNLKTEQERLSLRLEKAETESETALSRLWEEYEMTYSEAETMQQDLGSDAFIAKEIASLRGKIRALGNINIDSIEELQAVTERYEFLTHQCNDLHKAKRDLLHIIDEMQKVMTKQFKEEFDKIARHFKSTFTELFGGGRADLILEDESDVLNCGIQINVQPPGKKLQSLLLLSGGERALSAIALLFAILRIKPTPFCFLDEIEAALDENNVYRYADFIKRFSRQTQFILVTHRRGTMECADMIYGVTMQEKGVSKLLKLDLDEIEKV
ncbi:MAG: chromosome segregation protein SMC [Ruminococcaceae bacterium]|nr:chromosome segregation protein SMC [Oscillospiraceae bacterium]